jgi:hypothetical protein
MKNNRKKSAISPVRRSQFPPGWTEKRVREAIAYYDSLTDDEWLALDEGARNTKNETLMSVPSELVPAIGQLIAVHEKRIRKSRKKKTARA